MFLHVGIRDRLRSYKNNTGRFYLRMGNGGEGLKEEEDCRPLVITWETEIPTRMRPLKYVYLNYTPENTTGDSTSYYKRF